MSKWPIRRRKCGISTQDNKTIDQYDTANRLACPTLLFTNTSVQRDGNRIDWNRKKKRIASTSPRSRNMKKKKRNKTSPTVHNSHKPISPESRREKRTRKLQNPHAQLNQGTTIIRKFVTHRVPIIIVAIRTYRGNEYDKISRSNPIVASCTQVIGQQVKRGGKKLQSSV